MNIFLKKIIAYLILLVFLPLYIIFVVTIISLIDRFDMWIEFLVYVFLGVAWIVPFKFIFMGLASKKKKSNVKPDLL